MSLLLLAESLRAAAEDIDGVVIMAAQVQTLRFLAEEDLAQLGALDLERLELKLARALDNVLNLPGDLPGRMGIVSSIGLPLATLLGIVAAMKAVKRREP